MTKFTATENKQIQQARFVDALVRGFIHAVAPVCILVVFLIVFFIAKEALPFAISHNLSEIFNAHWMPESLKQPQYGILSLLSGSLVITALACLFAVPVGVLSAVYIAENASSNENAFLKLFIEFLASIPSVVIGFFGLVVLAPILKQFFHLESVLNGFTASLLLGAMALPTIISLSEDAIRNVPKAYREASLALGATQMETTWKVVFPAALPGVMAAVLLGLGRVVGETMVALMVTGNALLFTLNPMDSMRTLTATIAAEMGEVAVGSEHFHALFFVGLLLLLFTLGLNLIAQGFLRRSALASGGAV